MTKNKLNLSDVPTMFPIEMIERIILMSTDEGDTVLDPYMGSGTTILAADNLGRNSIGIDIDKRYQNIIKNRLKEKR